MKVFAAVLVACLVMSVYSQSPNAAGSNTGGATGASGTPAAGLLGGSNIMGLAAMSGQLGDGMQRMMRCQVLGLPPLLCFSM